jgi:ABC-type multidrug transport system ATPase subunit
VATSEIVRIDRATVRYGGLRVLRDVSFALSAGQVVAVGGANGAGKTTLLRLLAGVLTPSQGHRSGPRTCAYVPATLTPPLLAASRWLTGVRKHRREDPFAALDQLGFTGELTQPCRALSFGNLRKLLLADALTTAGRLVIIDEARSGLDGDASAGLDRLVAANRSHGAGVVLAFQDGQGMEGADSAIRIREGKIWSATMSAEVEISFRGPSERTGELTRAAEAIGFRPVAGRE